MYINETLLSPMSPIGRYGVGVGIVGRGLINAKTRALHHGDDQTKSNISCKKGKNTLVLSKYEEY